MQKKTIYTTQISPFYLKGMLFVRREQERKRLKPDEKNMLMARVPFLEDKDKSEWLLNAPQYVVDDLNPIFQTYSISEYTKRQLPFLGEKDMSKWALKAPQVSKLKPILLTYKISENTMKQLPLFACVIGKETLHHTKVSSDMSAIFNRDLDIRLRREAFQKSGSCPIFIKLFDAYPEVYENLKSNDGKMVALTFDGTQLTVDVKGGSTFIMNVQTIKNEV